jgi:hypothetical protein
MPLSTDNVLFVCLMVFKALKVALNTIKQTNKTLSVESGVKHHQQTNKTLSVESGIKHHQINKQNIIC